MTKKQTGRGLALALIVTMFAAFLPEAAFGAEAPAASAGTAETVSSAEEMQQDRQKDYPPADAAGNPGDQQTENQRAGLPADGTYQPGGFRVTGGTGRVAITCSSVTLSGGRSIASILFHSSYFTRMKVNGVEYEAAPAAGGSLFRVPVSLNETFTVSALTTAMSEPHWVDYQMTISLDAGAQASSENPKTPEENRNGSGGNTSAHHSKPSASAETKHQKLKNGTWQVRTRSDERMFHILPAKDGKTYSVLTVNGKKMTAVITLHGVGYDYLFMGSASGAVKAGRKSWTRFREKDGFYTYVLPVSALDRPLKIAAHSKKKNHWYQHVITFFSGGAKKLQRGAWAVTNAGGSGRSSDGKTGNTGRRGRTSGTQTRFRNDGRRAKVSRYRDDASGSTSPVNSRTGLKDGVYTPERFSWSGGSGRLSWIRCDKVTVRGGNAYASIVFGSSSYDRLRANGRVYARSGGGNSTFVIPVSLNRNNTIIGRTTAMSQPHWIRYTIFVGKGVPKARSEKIAKKIRRETRENRQHFAKTAPEIPGLSYSSRVKTKKAAYFRIFRYSRGVSLIQMKLTRHTGLKNRYRDAGKKEKAIYDEEGRKEGKTLPEIMKDLYHHDVVNYLVVPEKVTLPAGLEKDYIIIRKPADHVYSTSGRLQKTVSRLSLPEENFTWGKKDEDPDFRRILKTKTNLAVLDGSVLPEENAGTDRIEKKKQELENREARFAALKIPMIVDRSGQEKTKQGRAEWSRVWDTLFGTQKSGAAPASTRSEQKHHA